MRASTIIRDREIAKQVISRALADYRETEDVAVNGFDYDTAAEEVLDAFEAEQSISDPDLPPPRVLKLALRYLAASDDPELQGASDAAADLYRERWGEDCGEATFDLIAIREEA